MKWFTLLSLPVLLVCCCVSCTRGEAPGDKAEVTAAREPSSASRDTKPSFSPEAEIVLRDGTRLMLSEVSLVAHCYDRFGTYAKVDRVTHIDLPLKMEDHWWREIPMREISEMTVAPVTIAGSEWLAASILTRSGEKIEARIPENPDQTWYNARHFEVKSSVSPFSPRIEISRLRRVEMRDDTSSRVVDPAAKDQPAVSWTLTDAGGTSWDVREITFAYYWSAPLVRKVCEWDDGTKDGDILQFRAARATVPIRMKAIKRLDLTRWDFDPSSVHLTLLNGNEATGMFADNYAYLFGRAEDGRIWFAPLSHVSELDFALLPEG